MSKVLVNKTIGHVVLNGGLIEIPQGGHIMISDAESEISEVMHAARHGLVEMIDSVKGLSKVERPELPPAPVIEDASVVTNEINPAPAKPVKVKAKAADAEVVETTEADAAAE